MTETLKINEKIPFNFMKVYNKKRADNFKSKIDPNPVITKKGKKINLRDFVNEGFEGADLMTNLKKFGSTEKIKREAAFIMLDNMILEGDFRDLLDIQKIGRIAYNQLAVEERRNLTEKEFLKDFKKFKEEKNDNINNKTEEVKNDGPINE